VIIGLGSWIWIVGGPINMIVDGPTDIGGDSDTILEIVIDPNTTHKTYLVKIAPTYKHIVRRAISYLMWTL